MRDQHKTEHYWPERLDLLQEDKEFFQNLASKNPPPAKKHRNALNMLQGIYFETALAKYSAGLDMDEVAHDALTSVCDTFPNLVQTYPPKTEFAATRPGYSQVHRQIAILVLSKATAPQVAAYFAAFDMFDLEADSYGGYDRIWTAYRAKFGLPLQGDPAQTHWPEAFAPLWLAFDPAEPDFGRAHSVKKFLENWYQEMAPQLAAQTDRPGTKEFPNSYVGYWCIEAAAAVVALGLDDTSFRDHPHYPKDWADWARLG